MKIPKRGGVGSGMAWDNNGFGFVMLRGRTRWAQPQTGPSIPNNAKREDEMDTAVLLSHDQREGKLGIDELWPGCP